MWIYSDRIRVPQGIDVFLCLHSKACVWYKPITFACLSRWLCVLRITWFEVLRNHRSEVTSPRSIRVNHKREALRLVFLTQTEHSSQGVDSPFFRGANDCNYSVHRLLFLEACFEMLVQILEVEASLNVRCYPNYAVGAYAGDCWSCRTD